MHKLVKDFFDKRVISTDIDMNKPLHNAILYLEESNNVLNKLVDINIKKLEKNVPWSSMHDMYKRSYDHVCGVLTLFIVAQLQSSEALCRTAIESSVNLHYISLDNSMDKLIAYFKDYIETERKQNINWEKSINSSNYPSKSKEFHRKKIADKNEALDKYEEMLRESLSLANVNYDSNNTRWPNIFERFRDIDHEVSYRTIYMALCSQAHNDSEDILNSLMTRVIANVDGLEKANFIQQYHFSLYMVLTCVQFHIFASAMYIAKFEISAKKLIDIYKKSTNILIEFTDSMEETISQHITVNEEV
ncbi:hypothetical protein CVO_05995 [Sulfurimonas sp. CVO]|uniref:DUF5677 domain-containing protein n=1 Tax=Sulfurimonas sp. CVO TaxID=2283483 RepID=UPI00132E8D5D|nr:DUF5677 domain-containing protein [Sulfurimonas sp. CVO]QHG91412.1 hypothetical protein CVO_05995 [Sulfurimonas sp. CVO]